MKVPENWELLKKVSHNEIKPFVKECLEINGFYKRFYFLIMLISIATLTAVITFTIVTYFTKGDLHGVVQLLSSFLFSFTILVLIHELIHAIAYKIMGAKNVYFGGSIKKFIFYAASDQDIVNGIAFRFIALAPFVIVLVIVILLYLIFPVYHIFFLTIGTLHTLFCGGDFAMVNYISQYPLDSVLTFDSKINKESYFYLCSSENPKAK
ncbi:DUF3267 domain-containing protein [Ascidiimonas sp. W6]|uniref:DUF3267 domain-containing protein n=1 Tax=Ascidiimonas meishanensis TaxID=3128903 RepID=UPI0030EF0AA4